MNHMTNQIAHAYPIANYNLNTFDLKIAKLLSRLQKLYLQQKHNQQASLHNGDNQYTHLQDDTQKKIDKIETILKKVDNLIDSYPNI